MSTNAIGLRNQGLSAYTVFGELHPGTKPYIVSVAGVTYGENIEIVHTLQTSSSEHVDAIELNLSCPNVPGKPHIGYDFEALREVLRQVCVARTDAYEQHQAASHTVGARTIPIGLKLPAYFEDAQFKGVSEVLDDYLSEIAFISSINAIGTGSCMLPGAHRTCRC